MRNTVIRVVLFSCALITLTSGGAQALSSRDLALTEDPLSIQARAESLKQQQEAKEKAEAKKAEEEKKKEEEAKLAAVKQPVTHTVQSGENLTKIAESKGIAWRRLFDKNTQVADPNTLSVGVVLTVPEAEEQLAERPLPEAAPVASQPTTNSAAPKSTRSSGTVVRVARGSSAGNTYAPGYCTWYAKNRRPDLLNRLGNASSWVASAAAQGFATGSAPRAGAIGQQGNHVVYVESVNGDGTVTVSEMNYRGLFVVSSRVAPAGSFRYIY